MNTLNLFRATLRTIVTDEEGATAVEYGLIVGLIAVAIAAILVSIGTDLSSIFNVVEGKLSAAVPAG